MASVKDSRTQVGGSAPRPPMPGEARADGGEVFRSFATGDFLGSNPLVGDGGDSLFSRQASMVFGLLCNAVEEAAATAECRNVKLAAELRDLQLRALRSIQDSALVTIELFEALGAAQTPEELASRQIELARRQGESISERLDDFFRSARKIAAAMTAPPAALDCGPPKTDEDLLARLDKLTTRQKGVLRLLAEGLPNKVIAHRLGISETTVKAHVGEILRKLKVYNRARAIAMLAQIDATRIRALPAVET